MQKISAAAARRTAIAATGLDRPRPSTVTARHLKSAFATMGSGPDRLGRQGGPVTLPALLLTPGSVSSERRWTVSSTPLRGWASSTGLMQPPSSRRRHGCTSNAPAPNGGAMTTVSATRRPARASGDLQASVLEVLAGGTEVSARCRRARRPRPARTPSRALGMEPQPGQGRARSPVRRRHRQHAPGETITSNASTP
jgi:hypothetical protein